MNKGVFLDRDGVLNYPVLNPKTMEYEAPHHKDDFMLFPGVIEALKKLLDLNYNLFLVSNQPDFAKGKTTLGNLLSVHKKMDSIFTENKITFSKYYYCYHHPQGIIPEYTINCKCRKPGNLFLKDAKLSFSLDLSDSWMIGDRDVDIYCGQSAGTKTIMIKQEYSKDRAGKSNPDYKANSLPEAIETISKFSIKIEGNHNATN